MESELIDMAPELTETKTGAATTFETITPERAAADLANQIPNNRRLSMTLARMYARVMAAGRWEWDSPEGLIYDTQGRLCQGQHRLKAVAINGVAVRMAVTRDVPDSVIAVLDTGRSRTTAHRLAFDGYKNVKELAAIGRLAVLWDTQRFWTHGLTPAREEIEAVIEEHPELHAFAELAARWPYRVTLAPSQAGFAWWVLHGINPDDADVFMGGLRDGSDLHEGHPVLVLRNRLINDRAAGNRSQEMRILLVFLAWRAFSRREMISKVQLPSRINEETFRRVLGLSWDPELRP
jgi:hypothetical protein